MTRTDRSRATRVPANRLARCGALLGIALAALGTGAAQADDLVVYSPHVINTQSEIELRGFHVNDPRADLNNETAGELSVAHAFTGWWKTELYLAEYEKEPGDRGRLTGYEFENTFQLTEPGQYWADVGFLASYEHPRGSDEHDVVEFGPLLEKTAGRFDHRVNLIWEKELGDGAARKYEFRYSYAGTYAVSSGFRPGIEAYGRPADHAYQAGPIVAGEWHVPGTRGNVEYRFGMLFGVNHAAPDHTLLAQLEYEFF